jgi:diaminopimelate epimerase
MRDNSRPLRFVKMSGAGNDFVLVEGPVGGSAAALARRLCDRRRGVGADGLLVLERGRAAGAPHRVSYYNADGSAAFCGNGSRCAAWWMFENGWSAKKSFSFKTNVGTLEARITGPRRGAVRMPAPRILRRGLRVEALGRSYVIDEIDSGVPHAVAWVGNLDQFPVVEVGRALRFHKAFSPRGANVDFVEKKKGRLNLRTYERGVEDETLACGTGVVAAAVSAYARGGGPQTINLATRGGDRLKVSFKADASATSFIFKDAWLEGPVELVFKGELRK